jgi:hypothetical protein
VQPTQILVLSVKDWNLMGKGECIGEIEIALSKFSKDSKAVEQWFPLNDPKDPSSKSGDVRVVLQLTLKGKSSEIESVLLSSHMQGLTVAEGNNSVSNSQGRFHLGKETVMFQY